MSDHEVSVLGLNIIILLKALCDYANKNSPPITAECLKSIIKDVENNFFFTEIPKKDNYGPYKLFINLNPLKKKIDYLDINETNILSCKIDSTEYNNLHGKFAVQNIVKKLYLHQFRTFQRIFGNITDYFQEYKNLKQVIIEIEKHKNYPPTIRKRQWCIYNEEFYRQFFGKISAKELFINSCKAEFQLLREIFGDICTAKRKYNNSKFQLSHLNQKAIFSAERSDEIIFKPSGNPLSARELNCEKTGSQYPLNY